MTIATLTQPLEMSKRCPANLGVIDGRYQLVKWNSPPSVQAGALYLPSVNWLVFDMSPEPLRRVFRFVHGTSDYTCVGSPADSLSPVQSWTRGQYVYADACEMRFPADAPAGVYQVYTGMQAADGQLLPSSSADTPWLQAGQVEVQPHG